MGVENDEEFFVKPPEGSGTEVELPQRGTDGFEADELVAQRRADVDPTRVPSDASICRDFTDLEVFGVLERREGTQEAWAEDLGTVREVLARELAKMKQEGVIISEPGGTYRVLDEEALERLLRESA